MRFFLPFLIFSPWTPIRGENDNRYVVFHPWAWHYNIVQKMLTDGVSHRNCGTLQKVVALPNMPPGSMGDLPRSKNRFCVGWASEADSYNFLVEIFLEKIQKRLVFFGAWGFGKGVVARPSLYPHAEHIKNLFIFLKMILSNRRL